MADLVTHTAAAILVKSATGGPHAAAFVAGSLLPDILSRLPALVFSALGRVVDLPPLLVYGWNPLHMPAGMILVSWLLAMLTPQEVRPRTFWNLLAGMGLHLAIDLMQSHLGVGYVLLFPFSYTTYELGWIGSESTVPLALPLAAVTWLIWRRRRAS